jgi:hypothetical protein
MEEKIAEALSSEVSRCRHCRSWRRHSAAPGAPELANAQSILALDNAIEERWATEWWHGFAKMERDEFERIA